MCDADATLFGSVVTGAGFTVDHFDELEYLRIPAHYCGHTDVTAVRGLSRSLLISTGHQLFADIVQMLFIKERVIARPESLPGLQKGLEEGNKAYVPLNRSRHDDCGWTELE